VGKTIPREERVEGVLVPGAAADGDLPATVQGNEDAKTREDIREGK